jgi:hypothetical protein
MKYFFILLLAVLSQQISAACMLPDVDLKGLTKEGKKCEISVNYNEKYVSFEAGRQMCQFEIDDEAISDLQDHRNGSVTVKGYSNWFDCKVKLFFDEKGQPYRAKVSSRLTLALTFYNDECIFTP